MHGVHDTRRTGGAPDVSSGATIVLVNLTAFAIVYAATAHQSRMKPRIGD